MRKRFQFFDMSIPTSGDDPIWVAPYFSTASKPPNCPVIETNWNIRAFKLFLFEWTRRCHRCFTISFPLRLEWIVSTNAGRTWNPWRHMSWVVNIGIWLVSRLYHTLPLYATYTICGVYIDSLHRCFRYMCMILHAFAEVYVMYIYIYSLRHHSYSTVY